MTSEDTTIKGYRGRAREALRSFGVRVWSQVEIDTSRGAFGGATITSGRKPLDRAVGSDSNRLESGRGAGKRHLRLKWEMPNEHNRCFGSVGRFFSRH